MLASHFLTSRAVCRNAAAEASPRPGWVLGRRASAARRSSRPFFYCAAGPSLPAASVDAPARPPLSLSLRPLRVGPAAGNAPTDVPPEFAASTSPTSLSGGGGRGRDVQGGPSRPSRQVLLPPSGAAAGGAPPVVSPHVKAPKVPAPLIRLIGGRGKYAEHVHPIVEGAAGVPPGTPPPPSSSKPAPPTRPPRAAAGAGAAVTPPDVSTSDDAALGRRAARTPRAGAKAGGAHRATLSDLKYFTSSITALGRDGRWEESLATFEKLKAAGLQPSIITYSALISALGKGRQWARALSTFAELKAAGLEPNVITYSALISALEKGGQWEQALATFAELRAAGLQPNEFTYSALISALEKGGRWERALSTFEELKADGLRPNEFTYCALLSALEKGGQWERALSTFEELKADGLQPDVILYSALISALGKGGQWEQAMSSFAEMKAADLRPSVITYSALISALGTGGQWEKALSIFTDMKNAGLRPNVITYSALISVLGTGGQWEEALATFAELKAAGLHPNVFTYNALIRALSTGGEPQWRQALAMFESMRSARISHDNITCCEVVTVMLLLGQRSEAVAFFIDRHSQEYAAVFPRPGTAHQVLVPDGPRALVERIDLHNLSSSTARVAIICWLLELQATQRPAAAELDVLIVTGRGNRSPVPGESAVREAVLELLTSELKPPLLCKFPEHNPGCIQVPASDWAAWLKAVDLEAWLEGR